jgi:hypothetical protein
MTYGCNAREQRCSFVPRRSASPLAAAEEVEMRPFSLRVAIVVFGAAVLITLAVPAMARADAVTQWNANANAAILASNPTAHSSVLSSAMVQGAVYDAVNGIVGGYKPYLVSPAVNPWDSTDAAVATAAYRVLLSVVPASQTAALATLAAQYTAALAAVPAGAAKDGGIAAGEAAAAAMLAARTNDGRNPTTPFPFVFGTTPGVWRVSPPLTTPEPTPWVGNVKPFLVPDIEMLRTKGPNDLRSKKYAEDLNEVESLGSFSSATRTPDETSAAIFWQSPPLFLWGGLERSLSQRYGLSTADNARLFAEVSLAEADAAIGCWNDKYYWNFWRPIDAIRLADTDGNPATTADPTWRPLFDPATPTVPALATPNFPDHPSGHSCVTGSTMKVLQDFFDTDGVAFDLVSTRFAGTPEATRHFDSFSAATEEVINARVWGGIHFRTADEHGTKLGRQVAEFALKTHLQPKTN